MRTIGSLQKLVLLAAALCAGVSLPWGFVREGEIPVSVFLSLEAFVLPLILAGFSVVFLKPSRPRDGLILAYLLLAGGVLLGVLVWLQFLYGRSSPVPGDVATFFVATDAFFLAIFAFIAWRLVHVLRSGPRG